MKELFQIIFSTGKRGGRVIKLKAKFKDKLLSAFSSLFKLKGVRTSCTVGHAACTVVHCEDLLNQQSPEIL